MASIEKTKEGKYRAFVRVGSHRPTKTFSTKRDAKDWADRKEDELRDKLKAQEDGSWQEKSSRGTLRDMLIKYRDEYTKFNKGEKWEITRINAFLKQPLWLPLDKGIKEVSVEDFENFINIRRKGSKDIRGVKDGTILREMGLLSGVMENARRLKWIKENPARDAKKPSEPPARNRLYTRREIYLMLRGLGHNPRGRVSSITHSIAAMFLLAMRSGMRSGDMTNLKWEDVNPRHLVIKSDKVGARKGKGRLVPLSKKAVRIIERMRGFDTESVFAVDASTRDARFRTIRDKYFPHFRGEDGELKPEAFDFHDTRHTAATWIAKSFKSDASVTAQQAVFDMCLIFGWANPQRALDYYNPDPEDMAKRLD